MMENDEKVIRGARFFASDERNRLIFVILEKGPKTVREIATKLGKTSQYCNYTVKRLEKIGIVECINPEVRTGKIYSISDAGQKLIEFLMEHPEWASTKEYLRLSSLLD